MRANITISLPDEMLSEMQRLMQQRGFVSFSEFVRDVYRTWRRADLLHELEQDDKEIKRGNFKQLKSPRQLR